MLAKGVKGINLKEDAVVSMHLFSKDTQKTLAVFTDKGTGKRIKLSDFEKSSRARRGLLLLREVKTNPYHVIKTLLVESRDKIGIQSGEIDWIKASDLPITDRYSTGSTIKKKGLNNVFYEITLLEEKEEQIPFKEKVSLEDIDQRLMTIDDFLK